MKKSVTKELRFPQPREEVWRAISNREALAEWMYPNDFEAKLGHRFTFQIPANPQARFEGMAVQCEVLACDPPQTLSFSWAAMGVHTRVDYRLEVDGAGTKVFFEQSGFEQENAYQGAQYGWTHMHGKLGDLLQRGMA